MPWPLLSRLWKPKLLHDKGFGTSNARAPQSSPPWLHGRGIDCPTFRTPTSWDFQVVKDLFRGKS
jgi:hypothetical protein